MSDYLQVNEIAKLMRTSVDSIRFYEKKHIISPSRNNDNKYRHFTMEDIRRLYDCKNLQNLSFTLCNILEIITKSSEEDLDRFYAEKKKELQEKIYEHSMALDKINRISTASDLLEQYNGKYYIRDSPRIFFCSYANAGHMDMESVQSDYYQKVMDYHNLFDCTTVIPQESVRDEHLEKKALFGFSIDAETSEKLNIPKEYPVQELMPRNCVYTVMKVSPIITYQAIQPVYDWIETHNMKICGDILSRVAKSIFEKGEVSRILEVWIPFE